MDQHNQNSLSKVKPLYYSSQRQTTCCGKIQFISPFEQHDKSQQRAFCCVCCSFCCYALCNKSVNVPQDKDELQRLLPVKKPAFASSEDKITYTWIGHSTALISIGKQVNILIDPVFSQRCSPFQWAGPKRYRSPACSIEQLPRIDIVLVSHDHYDHLDQTSLNKLEQLHKPIFVAGLNSRDVFPTGCRLQQLDWTQTKQLKINGKVCQITFVPVKHWSKRWIFQKNNRLWGGFVINTPKEKKIFYSGDTAYCEIFQQIGVMFGPFDLAILPIGAYQPRFLMSHAHIDPKEAVKIHKEIKSEKSVGVHWGTFPLGFQYYYQPKQDLQKAKKQQGVNSNSFVCVNHGDCLQVSY